MIVCMCVLVFVCKTNYRGSNLSNEDTLNRGHLSNEDTACSPNHIELCINLPLN